MRRLQCNQVSFILAGIVLQIIASELYHGADCLALKRLRIHGLLEPLLSKLKKSDSDGSSFFKIDEGILSSLSEKATGFLGSFAKTKEDEIAFTGNGKNKFEGLSPKGISLGNPKEGLFTVSHKESSTEVDYEDDNKLFFNSENYPEPPEEEENVKPSPQQECGDKTKNEYSDSLIISVLEGFKVRLNIPIHIIKPKPAEKRQEAVRDYDSYEPFT